MSNITIKKIGITNFKADAVVNAANTELQMGGGVCGYIFSDAGVKEMTDACNSIGHCDTGSAVITPAFRLPAKYVIHAVGPIYNGGKSGEEELLYSAYAKSLELAKENDIHSIGMPVLSAGIFKYPHKEAWETAIKACKDFIAANESYDIDITFTVIDDKMKSLGESVLGNSKNPQVEGKDAKTDMHQIRIDVFKDTIGWIESDVNLTNAVKSSKKKTKVYYEDDYPVFDAGKKYETDIYVSGRRTFEAAMVLKKQDPSRKVAVMNFANAFHAGGGVEKGMSAQEECLCRCSTLYPLLYRRTLRDTFYEHHNSTKNPKATDSLIYTEDVLIIKTDEEIPKRMNEEDWVNVDVITIAAPDLRSKSNPYAPELGNGTYMSDAELFGCHVRRAIHMLSVAASMKADTLVLGAFGCGAFKNNREVVAKAYKVALSQFEGVFKTIEFAVYCPPTGSENYDAFKKIF